MSAITAKVAERLRVNSETNVMLNHLLDEFPTNTTAEVPALIAALQTYLANGAAEFEAMARLLEKEAEQNG